ncbi:hypothetical protein DFH06DRAFT_623584 [Mycena polygramma]|nr:hypothetical protein DFH06DRAFT_623584 [Mycena polygramma]
MRGEQIPVVAVSVSVSVCLAVVPGDVAKSRRRPALQASGLRESRSPPPNSPCRSLRSCAEARLTDTVPVCPKPTTPAHQSEQQHQRQRRPRATHVSNHHGGHDAFLTSPTAALSLCSYRTWAAHAMDSMGSPYIDARWIRPADAMGTTLVRARMHVTANSISSQRTRAPWKPAAS